MKMKLITLACLGLASTPLMAQSHVTIYGTLDLGVISAPDERGDDTMRVDSSVWADSVIGFKGEEDLGNGLKAIFQVEAFLGNDDATGLTGDGTDTFVGLAGGFGAVVAGRISSPLNVWLADYDHSGANTFRTTNVGMAGTIEDRANNTIAYVSPDMGGLQAIAFYSLDEDGRNDADIYGIGLQYSSDSLSAMYTYHRAMEVTVDNRALGAVDNHALGLGYDFGAAKLVANFIYNDFDAANTEKETAWNLGVSVPVGAGTISAGYGQERNRAGSDGDEADADIIGVTYKHDLSERTSLYAGYRYQDPKEGDSSSEYGVGITHSF